jgi:hypothetical protein
MIERRRIHLTAVCLLRDYLTPENHLELLAEASNKTKLQVQESLARRFPRPDVASYVRKLQLRATGDASEHPTGCAAGEHSPEPHTPITALAPTPAAISIPSISSPTTANSPPPRAPIPAQTLPRRALIEPTSEARYRIQLDASASLKEKLELFRALISHCIPSGDIAAVLERALELALGQVEKQRFARTDKRRSSLRTAKPRGIKLRSRTSPREHIPNAVQREVATRDALRCSSVSDGGCRCSARTFRRA